MCFGIGESGIDGPLPLWVVNWVFHAGESLAFGVPARSHVQAGMENESWNTTAAHRVAVFIHGKAGRCTLRIRRGETLWTNNPRGMPFEASDPPDPRMLMRMLRAAGVTHVEDLKLCDELMSLDEWSLAVP